MNEIKTDPIQWDIEEDEEDESGEFSECNSYVQQFKCYIKLEEEINHNEPIFQDQKLEYDKIQQYNVQLNKELQNEELQNKYIIKEHINYLLENDRN